MFESLRLALFIKFNQISKRQRIWLGLFLFSILVLFSAFFGRVSDEANWTTSGKYFLHALIDLQWDKTYVVEVSHRLGVSVLWVSALIYAFFGSPPFNYLLLLHRFIFLSLNLALFGVILFILKPYLKSNILFLLISYLFLNRFFPVLGRSTWLDQFLTFFGFLTVLFWTKYLLEKQHSTFFKASIFNGLLMLTKYAGWFFTPIIIALTLIYCYKTKSSLKKLILPLIGFIALSVVIFVGLYPAVWFDPHKALFLRLGDNSTLVRQSRDIWDYLGEIRLIDPILISGSVFIILDWKKKSRNFLFFVGLGGLFYLGIYLLIFLSLVLVGRIDYPFLAGIYRYTLPAIPILAMYTFYRYQTYIKNKDWQFTLVLLLFVREIIFLPFLIFK